MEFKAFPSELEAKADEPGVFEAYVSTFHTVDRTGDRMVPGSFKRSLSERGLPPIVWSHQWQVPPIGHVLEATEDEKGLRIRGRLFVGEGEDHPVARQVYAAMKAGALKEFSFGYEVKDHREVEEKAGDASKRVRELLDVEVFEVGPTLVGMNPATELLQVAGYMPFDEELKHIRAPRLVQKAHDVLVKAGVRCGRWGEDHDHPKGSGDTAPTISPQEVLSLLSKTRHSQEA